MPIVAITPCKKPRDYEAAVRRAGATPRPLALDDAAAEALRGVDGLLLTGGDDVDPALYGEPPHTTFDVAEPGRDAFEIDLVRRALDADLPVLAICRGLQVLNVALGGTLIQDIPSEPGRLLPHDTEGPPTTPAHTVTVAPGSCLAALVGPDDVRTVNSRHHQAVRALGRGLIATATSPDGLIEGAEVPAARFCVGVQWHPENFHQTGEFDRLFDGFVDACRTRARSGGSGG
ncbi:MAG TPA: gamma-glutamyl-gamma-aminobutyrate hydrolase family protein [Vicinamibacterales bacterium]|jgi:putative glutamine amidotransferase|nr:gamma-glutamyl-gamma-aminobutyrate hydrolase family protein [Vicinamibacterales bacterium]